MDEGTTDVKGKTLGKYEIVEEIGRGGMAIVYKALQPSLKRHVALKVLPAQLTFDTVFVSRFQQEAAAAAKLHHPNIVTIHDVDEEDGTYYIVMQYLEGRPLSQVIREEGPLSPQRAVNIAQQLAEAVDYAHSQGFVHRDIKPSNVIVDPQDHATLTDFGIVKAADGTSLTRTGTLVGTPEYMSPEQVRGLEVDHRSDVYSLGVVAYEMLAGRAPFRGDTATVLHSHVYEPPPPLGQVSPRVPGRMESVLQRALAKIPEQRYQTAGEMARVLAASLVAAAESAEAPTQLAGELETAALDAGDERAIVEEVRQTPEERARLERQEEAASRYRQVVRSVANRRYESALTALRRVQALDPSYGDPQGIESAARRGLADRAMSSGARRRGFLSFAGIAVLVLLAVAVIGGGLLLTVFRRPASTAPVGPVRQVARARLGEGSINEIAFSPRGNLLAVAGSIGVHLFKADSLEQAAYYRSDAWVSSVAFSPDGRTLASGSDDQTVLLRDMESGDRLHTLKGHTDLVRSVSFSPDGRTLASGSGDEMVLLWDAESGDLLHILGGHTGCVNSVTFSPDGRTLASGSDDGTVLLWDFESGYPLQTLKGHTGYVVSVAFSADGRILASASGDGTVLLWDVDGGEPLRTLEGHTGYVLSLSFSPDGRTLASGSSDEAVLLWDVDSGNLLRTLQGHTDYVLGVAFSPDGRTLASGSYDGTVLLWEMGQ
jgi:Tol biopolymer transport system component